MNFASEAGEQKERDVFLPVRFFGRRKPCIQTDTELTLTPQVYISTRKVCVRLHEPRHTDGSAFNIPTRSIHSAMFLECIYLNFLRSKAKNKA